jgi:PAS domain S-box-containing protein
MSLKSPIRCFIGHLDGRPGNLKMLPNEVPFFKSLADHSPLFIGMCDMTYTPFYVNDAGRQLVGLDDLTQFANTPVKEFFFPEDQDFVIDEFFPRVLNEGRAETEIRFRHFKTGQAIWMTYDVFFLSDKEGNPVGLATVSRDITKQKDAEEALREADKRKDEFIATLAHELRNPLSPISNGLHTLRRTGGHDETTKRVLDMMARQTDHLIRLVDDLLDVSRITSGKIDLRMARVDLTEIACTVMETYRSLIDEKGHHIFFLPAREPLLLAGDEARLTQVAANLISNAVKFTPEGGVITIETAREGDDAVLRVRDNGVGISSEMLGRVFDLFTQVTDRHNSDAGLGIGLALTRKLVELHGGVIEAQSAGLGSGATFIVRLPIRDWQMSAEPEDDAGSGAGASSVK